LAFSGTKEIILNILGLAEYLMTSN